MSAGEGNLRWRALATDGDGTLLTRKRLARRTEAALERLRASGRKLILVTGETPDQLGRFPGIDLFDLVAGENGGILYWPRTQKVKLLAKPPPARFARLLQNQGLDPLCQGRVIVSTARPHEVAVCLAMRELDLPWQIIFNRNDVMALPTGVDKATGLAAACEELDLSASKVVGIGDAENDLPLLRGCGYKVAVASAVPVLRNQADLVTTGGSGKGVVELVELLIHNELPQE